MQVNIISKKIHINFKYSLYYKEFAQQITIVKGAMVKKTWSKVKTSPILKDQGSILNGRNLVFLVK